MATFSHKDTVVGTNARFAKFLYNPSSMDDMVAVSTKGETIVIARITLNMETNDNWETEKATIKWFDTTSCNTVEEEVQLSYQKSQFPMSGAVEQLLMERGCTDVQICHF